MSSPTPPSPDDSTPDVVNPDFVAAVSRSNPPDGSFDCSAETPFSPDDPQVADSSNDESATVSLKAESVWNRKIPRPGMYAVGFVFLLLIVSGLSRTSPFVLVEPGPVFNLTDRITGDIVDDKFHSHSEMLLTTVSVKPLRWYQVAWQKINPTENTEIVARHELTVKDQEEFDHVIAAQLRSSKDIALAVADSTVSMTGPVQPYGAAVLDVNEGSPAQDAGLEIGDVITKVDDVDVSTAQELADAVDTNPPRQLTLTVDRRSDVQEVKVTPVLVDGNAKMGVEVTTRLSPDGKLPELKTDLAGVGGPSGGLMLTLAYIDALSPGDLTGGMSLAGTGTIDVDGSVGAIAGAGDKIVSAADAGAKVFFVPSKNYRSLKNPGGIKVVSVETVEDAVEFLCDHGATDQVCSPVP